jgi:hypothetical protein
LFLCGCRFVNNISCLVQLSTISHLDISRCDLGAQGSFQSLVLPYAICLCNMSALTRAISQLQALQKLYVGGNQLQYSDVEFIIESFPQLTELGINKLELTGWFVFCNSRTSCPRSSVLMHIYQPSQIRSDSSPVYRHFNAAIASSVVRVPRIPSATSDICCVFSAARVHRQLAELEAAHYAWQCSGR